MNTADVPDGARKIVTALVERAVARCYREGIALEDFYKAMLAEERAHKPTTTVDLIRRVFKRLATAAN
jgi:hypothetical protein